MALETLGRVEMEKMLGVGKVDVGNGTLFGVSKLRAPKKDGLTLVISTGGSGMSSIKEAMRIAGQKLERDYANFVKFIVIDSSKGEINAVKEKGITTLNISSPGAQARMEHSARPAFFKKFMPKDYDIALINEDGASQDRMTGKMKLYDTQGGTTNDTLFTQMIQGLFNGEWSAYKDLPVDIMILSGLSGGNGSGTFIDLAVRAKAACPTPSKVKVYGYLMLPDTAERFADSDSAKRSLYRNGFAALKELESYMSIGFSGRNAKVTIPSTIAANNVTLSPINLPFDYPVLISGDYDDAVSMIAETIVNLAADSGGEFDQKAFYSNIGVYQGTALSKAEMSENGVLKKNACPEDSHMYCGIGYAHASIPEKIVIPNIVSKVCAKLYIPEETTGLMGTDSPQAFCSRDHHLGRIDFEKQIRILFGLDEKVSVTTDSLANKVNSLLQSSCRLEENQYDITRKDILNGEVDEYLKGFNVEQTKIKSIERLQEEIKKLYQTFYRGAEAVMKQFGPRAMVYLYNGEGDADANGVAEDFSTISIKAMMQATAAKLQTVMTTPVKYPDTGKKIGMIQNFVGKKVDEWKGQAKKAAQQEIYGKVATAMDGVSGGWQKDYVEKVENFVSCCERFTAVLETLTDYYAGAGKTLDSDRFEEFSKSTGEQNGVNLCADAKMYAWVKDRVSQKVNSIKIADVKEALVTDFMQHSENWISTDPGKARREFDQVMSQCCEIGKYANANNGLDLSIMDYFDEILKSVPDAEQQATVNNVVNQIMARLLQSSAPSLNMKTGSYHYINKIILVPQSLLIGKYGTLIQNAFNTYLGGNGKLSPSSVVESIVCYQASVANPLSGLKDLNLWESGYEEAASNTMHLCDGERRTMYSELTKRQTDQEMGAPEDRTISPSDDALFGTGLSWRHYPSINVQRYLDEEGAKDRTTETIYRRDVFNKKIDYALKEGIIECERNENTYKYFLNLIPEDWENLSVNGYSKRDGARFKRGQELFDYLKNQNPYSNADSRVQICLTGSPFFGEDGFDFSEIIQLDHWKQELVDRTRDSYMRRIMRKNTWLYLQLEETMYRFYGIQRELEVREGEFKDYYNAELFAELFAYGVIEADEDEYEWKVKINARGGNVDLVTFGRRTTGRFEGFEKGLFNDGLRLVLAYDFFKQLLDNRTVKADDLIDLKNTFLDEMSDKELDQMIDKNVEILQKSLDIYMDLFGKAKDPVDEMLEKYRAGDEKISSAEKVEKFYEAVKEKIKTI